MSIAPRWLIVCPAGDHTFCIACTDCGHTPLFASADHALRVAHQHNLPRAQPWPAQDLAALELPAPYAPGMTFDVARAEFRALTTTRGRRKLLGQVK
jgi:hypothetical protein